MKFKLQCTILENASLVFIWLCQDFSLSQLPHLVYLLATVKLDYSGGCVYGIILSLSVHVIQILPTALESCLFIYSKHTCTACWRRKLHSAHYWSQVLGVLPDCFPFLVFYTYAISGIGKGSPLWWCTLRGLRDAGLKLLKLNLSSWQVGLGYQLLSFISY